LKPIARAVWIGAASEIGGMSKDHQIDLLTEKLATERAVSWGLRQENQKLQAQLRLCSRIIEDLRQRLDHAGLGDSVAAAERLFDGKTKK